ncbi:heparinase II/III domain-containing protein [Clostridium cellulovorans]|uniref:Heparinase II/III family protein n=1 Tax=Clostridium cellulovorans (strain ATCC 35296 / DSM 3052 / OCM 3 / 743B) TaxID=573061 RepID=D9SWC0_CLOC7|nr:heparinase II/III family protein [Clostridium cellulovorans]ADL51264.1 Heparinase II/III family protein [Clostridium cellulovorans 743B]
MINLREIKKALIYGNDNDYVLFPEVREKSVMDFIMNSEKHKTQIEEIRLNSNLALKEPSPIINFKIFKEFEDTGNRLHFENAYFKRRRQLFSLILDYIMKKNQAYIFIIEEKLWEWCDLYSWELPAHFDISKENIEEGGELPDTTVALFAAENAFFFAEILSLIGDELDEFLVFRLKKEIFRRVINPFKNRNYWWETAEMNWASVCAGAVGATAIYLVEDIDELSFIVDRVIKSFDSYLNSFDEDGITAEGLTYWSYGFSFYVFFAELLKDRTSGKISLIKDNEKIKHIARLPQILQFPSRDFVNFSDADSEKWQGDCGLFAKLEAELDIEGYNYENSTSLYSDHAFRWASMVRKIFWYCDTYKDSKGPTALKKVTMSNNGKSNKEEDHVLNKDNYLTGSFYFKESQWLVDRRNINGNFVAFAAKGGNNDEPHNHNDLGHFILHYKNENIFMDLGSPEYLKEYFNDKTRYDFLTASSLGHSVPVINDSEQKYGRLSFSKVIDYKTTDSKILFKLDLTRAYRIKTLVNFEREFIWDYKLLELTINDSFNLNKANNIIKEAFITKVKPELIEKGKVRINADNSIVEMLYPENLQCIIEECNFKNHSGEETTVYRTSFLAEASYIEAYSFKIRLMDK